MVVQKYISIINHKLGLTILSELIILLFCFSLVDPVATDISFDE